MEALAQLIYKASLNPKRQIQLYFPAVILALKLRKGRSG